MQCNPIKENPATEKLRERERERMRERRWKEVTASRVAYIVLNVVKKLNVVNSFLALYGSQVSVAEAFHSVRREREMFENPAISVKDEQGACQAAAPLIVMATTSSQRGLVGIVIESEVLYSRTGVDGGN